MIHLQHLLQNPDLYKAELKKRFLREELIQEIIELEENHKPLLQKLEDRRREKNDFNKLVLQLTGDKKNEAIEKMKLVSEEIKELEKSTKDLKNSQLELIYLVPNLTYNEIPIGKNENSNVVTGFIGQKPQFNFTPKAYYDLEIFKRDYKSAKGIDAAGYRGYYITGKLALLKKALYEYSIARLIGLGFEYNFVPTMVKENVLYGTGFFPSNIEDTYSFDNHGTTMYLTGTSEASLMYLYSNETLDLTLSPKKITSQTRCYRAEAGKHGSDTKGGKRVHEFEKIETVVLCRAVDSPTVFVEMTAVFVGLLKELGVYAHNLEICTGDISLKNNRQIDIEGYFPFSDNFTELASSSNCTDYQTRNLNIKTYNQLGEAEVAHSLNCTGTVDRLLWCLMEQFQNEDGTVSIPYVLAKYYGSNILD